MRTGIYGGTFNPIHNGHLHLLREFQRRLELERVILMPTARPPHKPDKDLAPGEDRLHMCLLAARELPFQAEVSDLELNRGEKSYTADTLRQLHALYPMDTLCLLMGADMFLTVERWYDPETIFSLSILCAAPRSGESAERLKAHGKALQKRFPQMRFQIEDIPFLNISSTAVRQGAEGLVPQAVEAYMEARGLYGRGT